MLAPDMEAARAGALADEQFRAYLDRLQSGQQWGAAAFPIIPQRIAQGPTEAAGTTDLGRLDARRGRPRKASRRPVSSQRGVVIRVARVGAVSVSTTLSRRRAPAAPRSPFSFSWASSHMFRQAMTVTTDLPASRRRATGCWRKAATGWLGVRNHTW